MTRTARRGGKKQAHSASTWTELKAQHINQEESDLNKDAVKLHRVKKNGLRLTKTVKPTSSLMPMKQLLKKLKKKTGKKALSTQDDLIPLLQASESEEEVTERDLGSVSVKEPRKPKKQKLSKQNKRSNYKKLALSDSDDHHDEGDKEENDSDQEPTEKSKLLRRRQRKRQKCTHKKHTSNEDGIPLLQSNSDDGDAVDGEDEPNKQQPKKKRQKVMEQDGDSLSGCMESEQSSGTRQKKKRKQKVKVKAKETKNLLKRREARRLRRQKAKICFNCRQPGHQVDRCPQGTATGMCFKCGSSEHTSKNCRSKIPEGKYPYAKCFICGEVGHLSKSCPDNPRGLYPQGGGCRVCGSVEHKQTDCPEKQRKKIEASLVITNKSASADAEVFGETKSVARRSHGRSTSSKHKVVTFQ